MSEYIKRSDALKVIADNNDTDKMTLKCYDTLIDGIYSIPSADVAPVRHGKWKHDGSNWENRWVCSECLEKYFFEKPNYCPNCGARMEATE